MNLRPQREMYTTIHFQSANDNTTTKYFYAVLWRHSEMRFADHRSRHARHVVLWQLLHVIVWKPSNDWVYFDISFSKEIIFWKNGSIFFKISLGGPYHFYLNFIIYFIFKWSKKLSNLNISWWVKYYGSSTKHSWNVCCTRWHRLVLRPIVLSA